MHTNRLIAYCALAAAMSTPLAAQTRATLPAGTVILVRTNAALESGTATVGQTFETSVVDTIAADNYTLIPAGSVIRGVITMARPATRSQSGVIELDFDRLVMPDGRTYTMNGKLTSTDAAERRQIDSTQTRVVLVGGRGGIGAAIAGTGSDKTGILSALGALLAALGIALGLTGALLLTRLMTRILFDVSPLDPLTYVAVSAGLAFAAILASYIPALRATSVDPVKALRH